MLDCIILHIMIRILRLDSVTVYRGLMQRSGKLSEARGHRPQGRAGRT